MDARTFILIGLSWLSVGASASAQPARTTYTIKPSEVTTPDGVPLGKFQRVTRPFRNWTLICDENLKARKRVCNVTQAIIDQNGATAFSWSLAGSDGGSPVLILRTPSNVGRDAPVTLSFDDKSAPIVVRTTGCNERVCVGVQPVGPRLRTYIAKAAVVLVTFSLPAGSLPAGATQESRPSVIGLFATFDGLSEAVASI